MQAAVSGDRTSMRVWNADASYKKAVCMCMMHSMRAWPTPSRPLAAQSQPTTANARHRWGPGTILTALHRQFLPRLLRQNDPEFLHARGACGCRGQSQKRGLTVAGHRIRKNFTQICRGDIEREWVRVHVVIALGQNAWWHGCLIAIAIGVATAIGRGK